MASEVLIIKSAGAVPSARLRMLLNVILKYCTYLQLSIESTEVWIYVKVKLGWLDSHRRAKNAST